MGSSFSVWIFAQAAILFSDLFSRLENVLCRLGAGLVLLRSILEYFSLERMAAQVKTNRLLAK